jgi:hypothetical protein
MRQRFISILATLGFAAVFVAAPVAVQKNFASLHDMAAFAAGNGHGGGRGNGHGKGRGNGQGPDDSFTASESSPGRSGSAPGHGGPGNGQAVGQDAVSGVESQSAHHNGYSLEGNMNAAHASAQGFAHAAPESMVGAIREAVQESYEDSGDEDTVIDRTETDEIDIDALEDHLADISNKDVDTDLAEAVANEVDGKVDEPELAGP